MSDRHSTDVWYNEVMPTTSPMPARLYSVRGCQGTTTVAASLALLSARNGVRTALASHGTDLPAILGTSETEVAPNLSQFSPGLLIPACHEAVVIDEGLQPDGLEGDGRKILVTRGPCYLALRAAVAAANKPDGVILLAEEGRSLYRRDVETVLEVPVIAEVRVSAAVARCIDAGLLATRLPVGLAESLAGVLDRRVSP